MTAEGGNEEGLVDFRALYLSGDQRDLQVVLGGVIGWLASLLMKTNAQPGAIANVIVGVVEC